MFGGAAGCGWQLWRRTLTQRTPPGGGVLFIVFYKLTRLELVAKGKAEHIALAVGVAHGDRPGLRIGRAV